MKNKTHTTWKYQRMIAFLLFLLVGAEPAFAGGADCKNSFVLALNSKIEMKFCRVPAAKGVNIGSENGRVDEMPVKPRNFKEFWIGQFEVTQQQYLTVTNSEPWKENGQLKNYVREGDALPADYITYEDAQKFSRALSLIDRTATYRLPTEAEWEYAARAGSTTNYFWGDKMDGNFAYFSDNVMNIGQYARRVDSCPSSVLNSSHPGYCANNFGLYHMLGNVLEWTADAYDNSYDNASSDGNVADEGDGSVGHVLRGGGWYNEELGLRSAARGYGQYGGNFAMGFRVVRMPK